MYSHAGQEAGPSKMLNQIKTSEFGPGPGTEEDVSVIVEEPPVSFSPFSLPDCTLLSHFSFNDFVAIAFPDLARDLDIQI